MSNRAVKKSKQIDSLQMIKKFASNKEEYFLQTLFFSVINFGLREIQITGE